MDKIEISDWCKESNPCLHGITINGKDEGMWDGREIQKWFIDHEQEIPEHFSGYGPKETDSDE